MNPLTTTQALEYQKRYGKNIILTEKQNKFWHYLIESMKNTMLIVLSIASIIAFFLGETINAFIIIIVVVINIIISIYQEYQADNSIKKLREMIQPFAKVIRDNKSQQIKVEDIVVYDHVILNTGDKVPADGVLIDGENIMIDESMISGESLTISKEKVYDIENPEKNNILYSGTIIKKGKGIMVVSSIGANTKFGEIAKLSTVITDTLSPLQKEVKYISKIIFYVVLVISVIFFFYSVYHAKSFSESIIFSVAIAVAIIPEGLITAITIALLIGIEKLSKKQAVIKKLSSAETLGCITTICSDKTGTITKNEMTVTDITTTDYTYTLVNENFACNVQTPTNDLYINNNNLKIISLVSNLCNESFLDKINMQFIGDPTEISLHIMNQKLNFDNIESENHNVLKLLEFDSERKMMSIIVKNKLTQKLFVLTKGSLKSILDKSTHILHHDEIKILDDKQKIDINIHHDKYAKKALRVLGFAYKELNDIQEKNIEHITISDIEKDLIYVGIVGMIDPPRDEVAKAIQRSRNAGIRTIMITGDNALTARSIAKQIDMINGEKNIEIIDGTQLKEYDKEKFKELTNHRYPMIFARTSPDQKYKIIESLQENGEIVGVTGDGINDAPALKKADIGIAMGNGSDVSKEVADMVLLDNNFATIINAIEGGRNIYNNIKKMIYYLFATNISELLIITFAVISNMHIPLTTAQILFINMIDVLPSVTLSTDKNHQNLLHNPPRDPKEKIMSHKFNLSLLFIGITISSISFMFYYFYTPRSLAYASTMTFLSVIIMQLYHVYNCKDLNKSLLNIHTFTNHFINIVLIITFLMILFIVYNPYIGHFFNLTPIDYIDLGIVIIVSLFIIFIEEIRKKFVKL